MFTYGVLFDIQIFYPRFDCDEKIIAIYLFQPHFLMGTEFLRIFRVILPSLLCELITVLELSRKIWRLDPTWLLPAIRAPISNQIWACSLLLGKVVTLLTLSAPLVGGSFCNYFFPFVSISRQHFLAVPGLYPPRAYVFLPSVMPIWRQILYK